MNDETTSGETMSDEPIQLAPLPWHQALWSGLMQVLDQGRLSHALLLSGPQGVGKRRFALALAGALLCEKPGLEHQACGICPSCRMLRSGGHPDAQLLGLDGHLGLAASAALSRSDGITYWEPPKDSKRREIAIDGVRSLIDRFSVVSHRGGHGGRRIAVIAPAEDLSTSSANALLKTIEEPRPGTHLVLIAEYAQALPATVRSRCQKLRFAVPPTETARAWLLEHKLDAGASQLEAALDAAHGAPLRALEVIQDELPERQARWSQLLAELAAGRGDPLKAATAIGEERAGEFLRWQYASLAAALRSRLAAKSAVAPAGWSLPATGLEPYLRELQDGLRRLDGNAKPQLVLESLLIAWERWLGRSAAAA
jgi:DNA polymerase-3 subunit delta'